MTPDRIDANPDENAEHGVLDESGNLDTASITILGGHIAQVSVDLPVTSHDDDIDDDVIEDEVPVDEAEIRMFENIGSPFSLDGGAEAPTLTHVPEPQIDPQPSERDDLHVEHLPTGDIILEPQDEADAADEDDLEVHDAEIVGEAPVDEWSESAARDEVFVPTFGDERGEPQVILSTDEFEPAPDPQQLVLSTDVFEPDAFETDVSESDVSESEEADAAEHSEIESGQDHAGFPTEPEPASDDLAVEDVAVEDVAVEDLEDESVADEVTEEEAVLRESAEQDVVPEDLAESEGSEAEHPEHVEAEHAETEHADAEHADAEHADAEHTDAEHVESEHADEPRAEYGDDASEQDEPEQDEPEQVEPEHVAPEWAEDEHTEPEWAETEQDAQEQDAPEQDEPEQDAPELSGSVRDEPERDELEQDEPEREHADADSVDAETEGDDLGTDVIETAEPERNEADMSESDSSRPEIDAAEGATAEAASPEATEGEAALSAATDSPDADDLGAEPPSDADPSADPARAEVPATGEAPAPRDAAANDAAPTATAAALATGAVIATGAAPATGAVPSSTGSVPRTRAERAATGAIGTVPLTRREIHQAGEAARVDRAHAAERVRTPGSDVTLASKRLSSLEDARESPDLLTADRLLDPRQVARPEPEGLWQQLVYTMSGHRINLGDGRRARQRKELDRRIAAPLAGGARFVPVLSRKGGVGKTTVTSLLGMALADARDDRVIAVDANPDRGTLADRVGRPNGRTVRDLVRAHDEVDGYHDVSSIVARDTTRLDVLASDFDPRVSEAFSDDDYRQVADVAAHYYSIVLTDTGTGIVHSVMEATLERADSLVVVAGLSVDEARLASETLTWLETNGYADRVRSAIVVLNSARPGTPLVRESELEAHFRTRVQTVIRMPYDPRIAAGSAISFRDLQPETRLAARELAAAVVEGLRAPVAAA